MLFAIGRVVCGGVGGADTAALDTLDDRSHFLATRLRANQQAVTDVLTRVDDQWYVLLLVVQCTFLRALQRFDLGRHDTTVDALGELRLLLVLLDAHCIDDDRALFRLDVKAPLHFHI